MPSTRRKRAYDEANLEDAETPTKAPAKAPKAAATPKEPSLLDSIRNMWQFANLYQWVLLFGAAIKLDNDFDIEDMEAECLKPFSTKLQEIGLSMLKFLSSHRGLTLDLFDEYARRQFLAKAPSKNPFGPAEEPPLRFAEFDIFNKIRVLQLMTQLIMMNPEKLRDKTEEHKDADQTNWRIEPYGWDREERTYFVLDDNRVYRMTAPPDGEPAASKPKKNSKKAKAAARASKRRRISTAPTSEAGDAGDEASEDGKQEARREDDGLGGAKWECVAVTLEDVNELLAWMKNTRDPDEKILRDQLQDHLVPILEKQVESKKRKQQQREKELLALEKMAHAKRSSRLAHKMEHQRAEEQAREEERRRREEEALARKQEKERLRLERERESRLMSREKRLKEREMRRLQHEEELAHLSEDSKRTGSNSDGRLSERRLKAEIEKNKRALAEINEEEDDWIFDCVCGVYGQVDDGTHSVACERCNVWQHSKCLGIKESDAERQDFHFICEPCKRSQNEGHKKIKIKVNRPGSLPSAIGPAGAAEASTPQPARSGHLVVELESRPSGSESLVFPPGQIQKPNSVPQKQADLHSHTSPPSANPFANPGPLTNGAGLNPFSSSHPTLSPPDQSPNKARAYNNLYEPLLPGEASPMRGIAPERQTQQLHVVDNKLVASTSSTTLPAAIKRTTPPRLLPPQGPSILQPPPRAVNGTVGTPSNILTATPQLTPVQEQVMTPLPPSRGGLSPTKQSPPPPSQTPMNGSFSASFSSAHKDGSPKRSILPPTEYLSPSPPQPDLTPPVKHAVPRPRRSLSPFAQPAKPLTEHPVDQVVEEMEEQMVERAAEAAGSVMQPSSPTAQNRSS